MDKNLRIISYNCQSFKSKGLIIEGLLEECDIMCLQETFVDTVSSTIFENFHPNFVSSYVPAFRKNDISAGRPIGGLALFWRKTLNIKYFPVLFTERIMGLKIQIENINYLLINIYCNCDYGDTESLLLYRSILADLSNICESQSFSEIIIVGDVNADPSKGRFFKDFDAFVRSHSLFFNDISSLPAATYSYISPTNACGTSFIDHVAASRLDLTTDHKVLYGHAFYDHMPISFNLVLPYRLEFDKLDNEPAIHYNTVDWSKVDSTRKTRYRDDLDDICLDIWDEVLACDDVNCSRIDHLAALNTIYSAILEATHIASDFLPTVKNCKKHRIIGWNTHCKELYATARESFLAWHHSGRIRQGQFFDNMKQSRASFKNALKYCRKNEENIRKNILLDKFKLSNKSIFWRETRKLTQKNINNLNYIDGNSDPKVIASIFDNKYRDILNDPARQNNSYYHMPDGSQQRAGIISPLISFNDICNAITNINDGIGWDAAHSNHLKFGGPIFKNLLCKLYNKFLSHTYLPRRMLGGQIRPVLKNNCSSKTNSANFRPVMNSSNFLKTFEICIKPYLVNHLRLSNSQFGFRANTSCMSAVAILKETVFRYVKGNSKVHCARSTYQRHSTK